MFSRSSQDQGQERDRVEKGKLLLLEGVGSVNEKSSHQHGDQERNCCSPCENAQHQCQRTHDLREDSQREAGGAADSQWIGEASALGGKTSQLWPAVGEKHESSNQNAENEQAKGTERIMRSRVGAFLNQFFHDGGNSSPE